MTKDIENYFNNCKLLLERIPLDTLTEIIETLYQAHCDGRQVFIMGNGGSASTASHFACDLGKGTAILYRPRFRVLSLNDNMAWLTAISNDISYAEVFKEQLVNLLHPGDVVIAISASGNSPNIVEAVKYAKSKNATTIGLAGFGGGKLKQLADKSVVVLDNNYGRVESIHSTLAHLITDLLTQKFKSEITNKAVFLDRDGVINKNMAEHDYVKNWEEFEFLPRAKEAIKLLKDAGYLTIVISNQAGIGKGLFSESDLENIHEKMRQEVEIAGGKLDAIYHCPHLKEQNCSCRKPSPGMLLEGIKKFNIDTANSFLVGDADEDIIAGKKAGMTTVFVDTGRHSKEDTSPYNPDYNFNDLFEFALTIAKK